ncbi:MAG: MFS transporter [Bacteroidales bacterium]|nr:MFS transporter [Bacteroidales bacterium]
MSSKERSPWSWVPTLYFAEGIPYFVVNVISVTMYKKMGMGNADLALLTSLLYLPWVIKPLWSPIVDVVRTKRWWILLMQGLITLCFAALAISIPSKTGLAVGPFVPSLIIFYIVAMLSATHDIAADGFYMIALDQHRQSLFVGIRSTFYRISSVFGQGIIVVIAGLLETRTGNIPLAWQITLGGCSLIFLLLTAWHHFFLPSVEKAAPAALHQRSAAAAVVSFFRKPHLAVALLFMLLFRLPEALSVKMLTPLLLDPVSEGGLALSTAQSGLVYGTVGVIALTVGGILGGIFAARQGLRKSLWPMALSLALPCAVYLYLSAAQPAQLWIVYLCVAFDQFGYGFGFTAYMLYLMYFSEGEYKTSHYAICTAFMALSMMLPGMLAGYLQEWLGYTGFFAVVMVCCLVTIAVTALLPGHIDPSYEKKV